MQPNMKLLRGNQDVQPNIKLLRGNQAIRTT